MGYFYTFWCKLERSRPNNFQVMNFLDAPTHLYKRLCPLVGRSVCLLVGLLVGHAFVKIAKKRRIHRESLLVALLWRGPQIKVQDQSINEFVNHSLNQSFIYKPGRIVGLCWPCFFSTGNRMMASNPSRLFGRNRMMVPNHKQKLCSFFFVTGTSPLFTVKNPSRVCV